MQLCSSQCQYFFLFRIMQHLRHRILKHCCSEVFVPRTKRPSPPTKQNLSGRRTGSGGSGCAFHLQVAANKAAERRSNWLVNFYVDHKSTVLGGPSECIAKLNRPISGNYLHDKHTGCRFFRPAGEHYYNKLVRGGTGRDRKKRYRFCIYHFRWDMWN